MERIFWWKRHWQTLSLNSKKLKLSCKFNERYFLLKPTKFRIFLFPFHFSWIFSPCFPKFLTVWYNHNHMLFFPHYHYDIFHAGLFGFVLQFDLGFCCLGFFFFILVVLHKQHKHKFLIFKSEIVDMLVKFCMNTKQFRVIRNQIFWLFFEMSKVFTKRTQLPYNCHNKHNLTIWNHLKKLQFWLSWFEHHPILVPTSTLSTKAKLSKHQCFALLSFSISDPDNSGYALQEQGGRNTVFLKLPEVFTDIAQ